MTDIGAWEHPSENLRSQPVPWSSSRARMLRGWALVQDGRRGPGIASLRRGIDQWQATGTSWLMPYYLCLLADALSLEGADEEASDLLKEAQAITERTGERWYDAERHRLAGEHARRRAP